MWVTVVKEFIGLNHLHPEIQRFIDKNNITTARLITLILMILQGVTFALSFFIRWNDGLVGELGPTMRFCIVYAVMFLATLQLFLYSVLHTKKTKNYNPVALRVHLALFLVALTSFSIYMAAYDYKYDDQILIFVALQMIAACMFMLRPCILLPFILTSFAVLYVVLCNIYPISAATNINLFLICVFLIMISILRYRRYLRIARHNVQSHILAEQMRMMSLYDPLTKLKNRLALRDDFEKNLGQNLILMLTDIDDFKGHNDTYGHEHGDEILCEYANLLKATFGKEYCYRYGGDEFLVVLPNTAEESFLLGVDQCKAGTGESFHFSGGYIIGKANSSEDLRRLIAEADTNLYKSKQAGKNRVTGSARPSLNL